MYCGGRLDCEYILFLALWFGLRGCVFACCFCLLFLLLITARLFFLQYYVSLVNTTLSLLSRFEDLLFWMASTTAQVVVNWSEDGKPVSVRDDSFS